MNCWQTVSMTNKNVNWLPSYLLALRLGFCGRHRDDPAKLAYYRKKLFNIVNRGKTESEGRRSVSRLMNKPWFPIKSSAWRHWPTGTVPSPGSVVGYLALGGGVWLALNWSLNQWMNG